jgi:hypothetical protein
MPKISIPFQCISCFFALLVLLQPTLQAADAPKENLVSLAGKKFQFTYPTVKGKPKDTILFDKDTMVIGGMARLNIPYVAKKKGANTAFEGTIMDAKLGTVEVAGQISNKGVITGSVTVRPKEGEPYAKNFNSAAQ